MNYGKCDICDSPATFTVRVRTGIWPHRWVFGSQWQGAACFAHKEAMLADAQAVAFNWQRRAQEGQARP
jgi:hypothetical protein